MSGSSKKGPVILLIENEAADIFLFRRALARAHFQGDVRVVGSVSAARAYLEGFPPFNDRRYFRIPDLIVSDMTLPGERGNAFLAWLRQEPRFSALPLVFFSGTFMPDDKELAGQLGARKFFAKSGDMNVMTERVKDMLALLPPETPPTA